MKILVVPDIHLKPQQFEHASIILQEGTADQAVCLMDIPDDWNHEFDLELYEQTYDAAIRFAKDHPRSLWCWGNHDLSYVWGMRESGYSWYAQPIVLKKTSELIEALPDPHQIAYIHRIDDVLFLHGGLTNYFAWKHSKAEDYDDIDKVIAEINELGCEFMWNDESPIWFRPQYNKDVKLYKADQLLQVVGHTPVEVLKCCNNVLSCDVFSTYRTGQPIGPCVFPIINTKTRKFEQMI